MSKASRRPCQGWGRGFESLRPLQNSSGKPRISKRPSRAVFAYKSLACRFCKPEVSTGRPVRARWIARFAADCTRAGGGEWWLRGIRLRAVECRRLWPRCWLDGSEREDLVRGACSASPPPGFSILGSGGSSRTAVSLGVAAASRVSDQEAAPRLAEGSGIESAGVSLNGCPLSLAGSPSAVGRRLSPRCAMSERGHKLRHRCCGRRDGA